MSIGTPDVPLDQRGPLSTARLETSDGTGHDAPFGMQRGEGVNRPSHKVQRVRSAAVPRRGFHRRRSSSSKLDALVAVVSRWRNCLQAPRGTNVRRAEQTGVTCTCCCSACRPVNRLQHVPGVRHLVICGVGRACVRWQPAVRLVHLLAVPGFVACSRSIASRIRCQVLRPQDHRQLAVGPHAARFEASVGSASRFTMSCVALPDFAVVDHCDDRSRVGGEGRRPRSLDAHTSRAQTAIAAAATAAQTLDHTLSGPFDPIERAFLGNGTRSGSARWIGAA